MQVSSIGNCFVTCNDVLLRRIINAVLHTTSNEIREGETDRFIYSETGMLALSSIITPTRS